MVESTKGKTVSFRTTLLCRRIKMEGNASFPLFTEGNKTEFIRVI